MKLTINNIGKLKNAEVVIDGITVITGENDTGKSTVGKVLWSVFNSFYKVYEQIEKERIDFVNEQIYSYVKNLDKSDNVKKKTLDMAIDIIQNYSIYYRNEENIKNYITEKFKENNYFVDAKVIEELTGDLYVVLGIKSIEIISSIIEQKLSTEFHDEIKNKNTESQEETSVELCIRNKILNFNIEEGINVAGEFVENLKGDIDDFDLATEAVFIDNPFIIDDIENIFEQKKKNYRQHLVSKLYYDRNENTVKKMYVNEKLEKIYKKLNSIASGKITIKNLDVYYKDSKMEINAKNLSTGLKTFAIIKMLLQNGTLEENGTIILDEPEIHLHPEWQLKFAELIVLLQKEFGMHILLTTHSPYFLNAIEVFSERHKIDDKCKYYVAENEGNSSIIKDVTGNTREIYRKLARPIQDLENIRYSSDSDE
nr:AAA family ATPase [uncultured Leptotrichia sp.]